MQKQLTSLMKIILYLCAKNIFEKASCQMPDTSVEFGISFARYEDKKMHP